MKKLQKINSLIRGVAVGLAVIGCIGTAKAIPFASGITNVSIGGSNYINFIINESGGSVSVVTQPDGMSNVVSANCPAGLTNYYIGANTSWQVYCSKTGNGVPIQITTDTLATTNATTGATNWLILNLWPTPRGIDINKNPKIGNLFGRMYIGHGAIGASISTNSGVTQSGQAVPGTIVNFRGQGLYALNADCTDALGFGTNAAYAGGNGAGFYWTSTSQSSPWKLSVNPTDGTIVVGDESTANGSAFIFDPNFVTNNAVYGTNCLMLAPLGETQGEAAHTHGDVPGTFATGSIATSNLVLWTMDPALPCPTTNIVLGVGNEGQTVGGQFGLMCRYDIGAGPLPWPHGPNAAVNLGLPTLQDITTGTVSLGPDLGSNFVYCSYYRGNFSDPNIQVFTNIPTVTNIINGNPVVTPGYYNLIWSSQTNSGGQMVLTGGVGDIMNSAYCGVRVSPDGQYLAAANSAGLLWCVNLTNGIPDNSSLITIVGAIAGNSRGLAFDAADNIYMVSSGTGTLRGYSLNFSATTVTGNDTTGTNGTFQIIPPPATATVVATQSGSQNYVNSSPAGTPIPGIFTISLNTNYSVAPVSINITLGGSAALGTQYTINSSDTNGVTYSSTKIVFPAGTNPATGNPNWTAQLICTPTATPLTGPSTTVSFSMVGGSNYAVGTPHTAALTISNTGPQYLFLTAASVTQGTTMNRGIPGDYARFTLTRWGDLNGPGNSASSITARTYTVTNITYGGTAVYTNDYAALAQRLDSTGNGVAHIPTAGNPGIVIYPYNVVINCDVGLPVFNTNVNAVGVNKTITIAPTEGNPLGSTNGTSVEGYAYTTAAATNIITLSEIDNAKLAEVVIWTDPLTNSVDPGWTLTYDSTNMNLGGTTLTYTNPVVVANYTNTETWIGSLGTNYGGSNDFEAYFGWQIGNESSYTFGETPNVPLSPQMVANGWSNALRITVNKDGNHAPAAVNLYPTNQIFAGNIGLRFEMFLSTYYFAQGQPAAGTVGREFGIFGIDHYGTNCNWRPALAVNAGTGGNGPTNNDGTWMAIDAGSGSITPADYDAFNGAALPNSGNGSVTTTPDSDVISTPNTGDTGIFKDPPFTLDESTNGGDPANAWVEVSLEKSVTSTNFGVFNVNLYLDHNYTAPALPVGVNTLQTTTPSLQGMISGNYTNGCIMLGYEDPVADVSDQSAFVYYSNVRVVELSPFIAASPTNMLVLKGAVVTNTSTAIYSYTGLITNIWFRGTTTPATAIITNTMNNTNFTDSLVVNTQTGSNYWTEFSDASGGTSVSYPAAVEVVTPPANVTAGVGAKAVFTVSATGQAPLTAFQWATNGVNLATSTKYTSVTSASLTNQSVTLADSGTLYSVTVQNSATNQLAVITTQSLTTPGATLTVPNPPSGAVVSPAAQTNVWGSSASFTVTVGSGTPPYTYGWKKNGAALGSTSKYSGTNAATLVISNLTQADDSTNYTVLVTNASGSVTSTMGSLVVYVPPPTLSGISADGSTISFTSTNSYDNSNAFILLSSPSVSAALNTWTNASPATFSGSAGSFQVITAPAGSGSNMFYILKHVN